MGHSNCTAQLSIDLDSNCDRLLQLKTRFISRPRGVMNAMITGCQLPADFRCKRCIWGHDLRKEAELTVCYPLMLIVTGFNQVLELIQRFYHMCYGGVVFERCCVFCHFLTQPVDCSLDPGPRLLTLTGVVSYKASIPIQEALHSQQRSFIPGHCGIIRTKK